MLRPALLRHCIAQLRLGLADAGKLLRDVERRLQPESHERAALVVRVVGERRVRLVRAARVVEGGSAHQGDVGVQLGTFDVDRRPARRHLLRRRARLRPALQRPPQHLVFVGLRRRLRQLLLRDVHGLFGRLADEQADSRDRERRVLVRLGGTGLDLLGQVVDLHQVGLGDLVAPLGEQPLRALPRVGDARAHLHDRVARPTRRLVSPVGARHVEGSLVVRALQKRRHGADQVIGRGLAGAVFSESVERQDQVDAPADPDAQVAAEPALRTGAARWGGPAGPC